jgi:small subunit ribosomal protein S15
MSLHRDEKAQIVNHFKRSELDTGSSEVQVALLTFRINKITDHFKTHKKDYHGQRGLVRMVNSRRNHLDYLMRKNPKSYQKLIDELGIRK